MRMLVSIVSILALAAGCAEPPPDVGSTSEAQLKCGLGCTSGTYPASYSFQASCCPNGGCPANQPNDSDCEPIPSGQSYASCQLSCDANSHVASWDFWPTCCVAPGCSAIYPNRAECAPNSGTNFTACGLSCPAGYVASSYSYSPTCCEYQSGCTGNNAVSCVCTGSSCPPPPPPPPPTQTDNATFVSQSVPTTLAAGQSYTVSVTMKNSGTTTWTAAQGYKLGSQDPRDNVTWGTSRVLLANTDSIAPGQSKTFTFSITAPTTQGGHAFQWQMVRENVAWFGALSTAVTINVGAAAPIMPTDGAWYNPARSGWGLALSRSGSNVVAYWLTYTTSGAPTWYLAVMAPGSGNFSGQLLSDRWSNGASATVRGTMTLTTSSATGGTLSWVLDGVAGSEPVQYLAFGSGAPVLPVEGSWYPPSQSGWGQAFDVQGSTLVAYFLLYSSDGSPIWLTGSGGVTASGANLTLTKVTGVNLCPGCSGTPVRSATTAGSFTLGNVSGNNATLGVSLLAPLTQWNDAALPISRLSN